MAAAISAFTSGIATMFMSTPRLKFGIANASPAFRATLAEYAYLTGRLRQPRHDYLLRTRQAALALLDGDIETGEWLSAEAATLGEQVGEGDTGNVRMSQRLEIVRARNHPAELRDMAEEAVRWWIRRPHTHMPSPPGSMHAPATSTPHAGNSTRCLPETGHHRSYLWSIFIGEMAAAAIARRDACCASGFSTICSRSPTRAQSMAPWSASWAPMPTASGCSMLPSAAPKRPANG